MTATYERAMSATGILAGNRVGRVGFGAMQLVEPGRRSSTDRGAAEAVLRTAVELGVNHIDTAGSSTDMASSTS